MRICADHWQMMRDAVDLHGMTHLVAKDGETAHADLVAELQGEPDPEHRRFDPLMSMHWHWTNNALRSGGLYLLTPAVDGEPHCPVCEFQKHQAGFIAKPEIEKVAEQMATWCRTEGLIGRVS